MTNSQAADRILGKVAKTWEEEWRTISSHHFMVMRPPLNNISVTVPGKIAVGPNDEDDPLPERKAVNKLVLKRLREVVNANKL